MPSLPKLNSKEAVKLLEENNFVFSRQKGSHAQYYKNGIRVTIPIHNNDSLHPKIIKQVYIAIQKS
jgi:predicted RNA binding protein YcfA (HicA-like mRNA interferase family)